MPGPFCFMATTFYKNDPNLKAAGVQVEYTQDQFSEYVRCSLDPVYFLKKYAKIVSLDRGVINFELFGYQERMIRAIHENRFTVGMLPRQMGKSTVVAGYIAWYIVFNADKRAAILANKQLIAQEIFGRVKMMIENLPHWLQPGIEKWAETSIKFENGSSVFCSATSESAVRGTSINLLLLDEFAHLKPKLADAFIASVFPTISSAKSSKMVIVSTPKGMNHFHKLWVDAESGKNAFVPMRAEWHENPNRDEDWARRELAAIGKIRFAQEVECAFAGSSKTLIDGAKIASIPNKEPIFEKNGLRIFKEPKPDRHYVCTVDTSRGQHLDYSAFVIVDITNYPYEVAATYKNNTISTMAYPSLIVNTCKQFNDAYCLIEINDAGGEVANIIFYELEYENVYFTHKEALSEGVGYPGVRTTKRVKMIGTSVLKDLVEMDQLIVNSHEILQELSIFAQKGTSYAAEDETINDDLTTCLWLFAWLTKQAIFSELTGTNIRLKLTQDMEKFIEESMTPFGIIDDGHEEVQTPTVVSSDPFSEWVFK